MVLTYNVKETDSGRKVYSIMRWELNISAALTRRLKQADAIHVDGKSVYTNHIVTAGELVELDITAAEFDSDIVPECGTLEILYEDAGLIAVNKPSGMITHPSRAKYTGTLANIVAGYLLETSGDACSHSVNRLDRDTSGVVLFAKNTHMKALAAAALSGPNTRKEYIALIEGCMEQPSGTIDIPIKRLNERDLLRVAAPDGQRAVTHYETTGTVKVGEVKTLSVLRLYLETGRTHQIRVHCLASGHPVLGDILYYTDTSRALSEKLGMSTQALHALRLTFTEPITGKKLILEAPVPEVFKRVQGNDLFTCQSAIQSLDILRM